MARKRTVGSTLVFDALEPSVVALKIAPSAAVEVDESMEISGAEPATEVTGAHGGRVHLVHMPGGRVTVQYRAETVGEPRSASPVGEYDDEVMVARRQSRYCPSDKFLSFALAELGQFRGTDELADAAADWVFERIAYTPGVSGPSDDALDTLIAGRGICRDMAHLTIMFCRALGTPARMVSVYAPGITPMDFHAVVEVWRRGRWEVIDPTRLAPRASLLRIATGRDAADTALAGTIRGDVALLSAEVFATVEGDLPADDHRGPAVVPV